MERSSIQEQMGRDRARDQWNWVFRGVGSVVPREGTCSGTREPCCRE